LCFVLARRLFHRYQHTPPPGAHRYSDSSRPEGE
jgi:hypothetical protein